MYKYKRVCYRNLSWSNIRIGAQLLTAHMGLLYPLRTLNTNEHASSFVRVIIFLRYSARDSTAPDPDIHSC